jgi:hypothetical protein
VFGYEFGRKTPDIVLLQLDADATGNELEGIFIGEVKLSEDRNYLKKGLEQLLEYGAHAKFGHHLRWAEDESETYIADSPDVIGSTNFELGYFVGNNNEISGTSPPGIQIYGYGDEPDRPLADN